VLLALLGASCTVYADPIERGETTPAVLPGEVVASPGTAITEDDLFCPSHRPLDGAACTFPGSACEYGSSPDLTCNAVLDCADNGHGGTAWKSRPANPQCVPHDCPKSFGDITPGASCEIDIDGAPAIDAAEFLCAYDQGTCGCTTGADGAHAHARAWECAPAATMWCPKARPAIGSSCGGAGLVCDYGSCLFKHGTALRCEGEHWAATEITCP
jgi:hypothetical protein